MRAALLASVLLAPGCGAAAALVAPSEPAPAASTSERASTVVGEPATEARGAFPLERVVLIDGVRSGMVLDRLGDFTLVGGAGTIALVGPDGHVRAAHRFAFGADGATGVFLDAAHAVVGNSDHDGFRGPWAGRLDRWDLDRDTLEQLTHLGYVAPPMARLGDRAVVLDPTEGRLFDVSPSSIAEIARHGGEQLVWPADRRSECMLVGASGVTLVRVGAAGALTFTPLNGEPPASPPPEPLAGLPGTGARGLPSLELAPASPRLAIGTADAAVVLGPDGIGASMEGRYELAWDSEASLRVGGHLHPFEAPTVHRTSLLVDDLQSLQSEEPPPEFQALEEWRRAVEEASAAGDAPPPPPSLAPVCSSAAPIRCVRAHLDGTAIDRWELFDPQRPARALARVAIAEIPPGRSYVAVAPGGRYVRVYGDGARLVPVRGGPAYDTISDWVELAWGWVFVDPDEPRVLRVLPFEGEPLARTFEGEVEALEIVDAEQVLVRIGALAHVLSGADLATRRILDLSVGRGVRPFHCEGQDLVQPDGPTLEGACPVRDARDDQAWLIQASADRSLWIDGRLGDEVIVHRAADGAVLSVRVTTDGVLAVGPGGVFEASGAVADRVVVREAGPVRSAAITAGAEARARFERPGLVSAFFGNAPLPIPP